MGNTNSKRSVILDWDEVFKFVFAALASVGASGAIIFALSSWLGKVWAERILSKEKHELNKDLESAKTDLELLKETTLRFKNDKILTYRSVIDVISNMLSNFDAVQLGTLTTEDLDKNFHIFNQQRIQVYGYLAMLAPQDVMDAQDNLMDLLIQIFQRSAPYDWEKVRELALKMLNAIRDDIGIDINPIAYNGKL